MQQASMKWRSVRQSFLATAARRSPRLMPRSRSYVARPLSEKHSYQPSSSAGRIHLKIYAYVALKAEGLTSAGKRGKRQTVFRL